MRKLLVLVLAAVTAVAVGVAAQPASAGTVSVDTRRLREAVTSSGILAHERALQWITQHNNGVRAAGTPGFEATAAYVEGTLRRAGFSVKEQKFTFPYYQETAPPELTEVSPTPTTFTTTTFGFSANADVTGVVVPTTDVMVPPPPTPGVSSGCELSDFPPITSTVPQIALIQRGTCSFGDKVANAEAAGYDGVILFNEGQPGRDGPLGGTVGFAATVPVVGALPYADGAALYAASKSPGGATVHLVTHTVNIADAMTENIIAETRGGDPNHVVLIGIDMDALSSGPGINENGSGISTSLEIAEQISRLHLTPRNKIRFVFFGAEANRSRRDPDRQSIGLLGSNEYVKSLSPDQLNKIKAYVNLDTLGSLNYVRFVFNGDGPAGSEAITKIFTDYFTSQGLATEGTEPTTFDGASFGPLADAGIPTGGLFGGAAGVKTDDEAAAFGGTAGDQYDACFHQACDTINNLNATALSEFGDGAAHTIWTLAMTRQPLVDAGTAAPARAAGVGSAATGSAATGFVASR